MTATSARTARQARRALCYLLLVLSLWPAGATATVRLYDGETFGLSLSGYLRSLSGDQVITYDTLGLVPEHIGLTVDVLRFEWNVRLGDKLTLQLHNRFLWSATTSTTSLVESSLGIGASTPPARWLDLESALIDQDQVLLTHDIDRLMLQINLGAFDITLGRQAVTWGIAKLFPVADLWTQFSPFELDTTEKRGIDAARVMVSPLPHVELDLLVADRGSLGDLSAGIRAVLYLSTLDLHLALGKLWNELLAFAGVTIDLGQMAVYLDATWGYHLDDEQLQLPRLTAGLDLFSIQDLVLAFEYHFNGLGVTDTGEYLAQFTGEAIQRGETYLVGQHYLGLMAAYNPTPLVTLSLSTLSNLLDPSLIVAPSISYSIAQNVDLSAGGYLAMGEQPAIGLPPTLHSEFGTYPYMAFIHLAAFF
ncbi:MAG: hypothetical protein JW797_03780 [Bradymonadales bacterium]|nr:hypothetical protein [Bradymonadales bacterium]